MTAPVPGLHSSLEENLHSISPPNTDWTCSWEAWRLHWPPQNSSLRQRQPALPVPCLAHPVPRGLGPSSELPDHSVCLRGTGPMWTLSGILWGCVIVLNVCFCTNRKSLLHWQRQHEPYGSGFSEHGVKEEATSNTFMGRDTACTKHGWLRFWLL